MHSQLRRQRQVEKQQENDAQGTTTSVNSPFNSANNKNKNNNKNDNQQAKKIVHPKSTDPEDQVNGGQGYTLILRGLTTDLASIYRDAIPRFLLPRIPVASSAIQNNEQDAASDNDDDDGDDDDEKDEGQNDAGDKKNDKSKKNSGKSLEKSHLRPINATTVAFRAETASAYVSVPKEELERAFRLVHNNNTQKATNNNQENADGDAATADNNKKNQQNKDAVTNSNNNALVKYCKHKDLFGARLVVLPATSNHDQSGLVSIPCAVSKPVTAKQLSVALQPIEGFTSVINTVTNQNNNNNASSQNNQKQQQQQQGTMFVPPSRYFRLVFKNEKAMFGAKKLLDEFPAAEGVKVTVQLNHNDNVMRRFLEYVHQEEDIQNNASDMMDIVPVSNNANANDDE